MKERHFTKEDDIYSLHQNIKQHVTFKQHDLLMQSFDTNYDLIVCRNVMIYFTEEARVKLYEKFSRSLRKGGVLFVGSTEQILTPERFNLQRFDTFFYEKYRKAGLLHPAFLYLFTKIITKNCVIPFIFYITRIKIIQATHIRRKETS